MARSPWRDALDGKITVLRSLRGEGARLSLYTYFSQATSLEGLPVEQAARRARAMTLELQQQLIQQLTEAEPFSLTNDIQNEIVRHVNAGQDAPGSLLDRTFKHVYTRTSPPVPSGFIWLHEPVAVFVPPPDLTEADLNPEHPLDPNENVVASVVRAIMFSPASYVRAPEDHPDPTVPTFDGSKPSLRIVAFIDGDDQHSAWGMALNSQAPINNRRQVPYGLIPVMLPYVVEHETIEAQLDALAERYSNDRVDMVTHAWPTLFLFVLFEMMRSRVLLWGGSGLERDARKAAERAGLSPIVQVVDWRKATYRYPNNHIPGQIDWSCSWPVSPHVRRYRNPDGSIRKEVVISGYVKGPLDKPLKAANTRVNHVKR